MSENRKSLLNLPLGVCLLPLTPEQLKDLIQNSPASLEEDSSELTAEEIEEAMRSLHPSSEPTPTQAPNKTPRAIAPSSTPSE